MSFKSLAQVKFLWPGQKVGQILRSRSQGQKVWYRWKGPITRNTHVKYESPMLCHLKVMA